MVEMTLDEILAQLDAYSEKLKPADQRKWDVNSESFEDWEKDVDGLISKAITKEEQQAFSAQILKTFKALDSADRMKLENAMQEKGHSVFRIPASSDPEELFRNQLLAMCLFGDRDTRDVIMGVSSAVKWAREQDGVNVSKVINEVSEYASPIDKYGMGSMRSIFLGHR